MLELFPKVFSQAKKLTLSGTHEFQTTPTRKGANLPSSKIEWRVLTKKVLLLVSNQITLSSPPWSLKKRCFTILISQLIKCLEKKGVQKTLFIRLIHKCATHTSFKLAMENKEQKETYKGSSFQNFLLPLLRKKKLDNLPHFPHGFL